MSEREKILRFYRASGDGDLAAQLVDLAEAAIKNRRYKVSEFLDPFGYSIAETVAAHFPRIRLAADGGYQGAERVKASFAEEEYRGSVDFGLTALAAEVDVRYYSISHRDVLGAVLALGVKREVIGDIVMGGRGCQIICDLGLAAFIKDNLRKIGPAPVEPVIIPLSDIAPREEKVKEIRATVASLRLDTVAAAGFGTSRSQMTEEIEAAKVKLNWQDAKGPAQAVKGGDIISMRGRGRVEVVEIIGTTKKGRTSIFLKRFM